MTRRCPAGIPTILILIELTTEDMIQQPLGPRKVRPSPPQRFRNHSCGESAKVRAYELCGKELGMFDGSADELPWSGDLADLTSAQLAKLSEQMQAKAFPDGDPAAIEAAKREAEAIALLSESVQ
jgi:hypothetical protein